MHPVISTPFNQYYTFTDKPTSCNNNKPSIFCFPKINLDLPTILQFLMTLTKQGEKKKPRILRNFELLLTIKSKISYPHINK